MLANLLIGLREGLEASLIVGILIAYVVKIDRRDVLSKIWVGVAVAVAVSLAIGALLAFGLTTLPPNVEPLIAGTMSILATGLVTWMIFWMARTARDLRGNLQSDIDKNLAGAGWGLVLLAFLAVGREGIETAVFIWAAAQATQDTVLPLLGAVIGLGISITLGYFIYRGMVRLNLAKFFTWSGALLIIVAAGVLINGFGDLQEVGVFPGANALAFDISGAVPEESWYGSLLKGIFGFSAIMNWSQVILWVAFVGTTLTLFLRMSLKKTLPKPSPSAPSSTATTTAMSTATSSPATLRR
ncbi:FTR1 family protein [Alpinimonas psychrophila]|uniref:High-affinity iron transporter n=1 Tax=Alpinimonas psychrophila TaxID=748908 RepID=A0A7W3JS09_9MICO|nr:iron uptake transporter permease EfeU [Alpinimonas psychrophila]MBA8828174.1 high-affinity iron transporter [Alpinimonas psychrophila]